MATSIPISGLNELLYITEDDFFAFVDSGSITTYRVSVKTFEDFFSASGSALSCSWASRSISSSHAIIADTASYLPSGLYLITASWAENVKWETIVGTASIAYNAKTASKLEGIGNSYENSLEIRKDLSVMDQAYVEIPRRNNMYSTVTSLPSIKANSLFLNKDYISGITDYGKVYFYEDGLNRGKFVFEIGDDYTPVNTIGPDIDSIAGRSKGFLFQTNEAGNTNLQSRIGTLLFISGSGTTYGRIFEGGIYSSSIADSGEVAFYGTASYALNSDFSKRSAAVIPTGLIVAFASSSAPDGWLKCDGSLYNTNSYVALENVIHDFYGKGTAYYATVKPETTNTYQSANDGFIKLTFTNMGSGLIKVMRGSTAYYPGTTGNVVTVSGLDSGNYSFVISDIGYTPSVTFPTQAYTVPYGGTTKTYATVTLASGSYRLPQLCANYFVTASNIRPLIWIIKT